MRIRGGIDSNSRQEIVNLVSGGCIAGKFISCASRLARPDSCSFGLGFTRVLWSGPLLKTTHDWGCDAWSSIVGDCAGLRAIGRSLELNAKILTRSPRTNLPKKRNGSGLGLNDWRGHP